MHRRGELQWQKEASRAQDFVPKARIEKFKLINKINSKNGTIQAPQQEKKAGKIQKADKMGSVLDSAENIRQDEKNPSRKAHKIEKKLEKDEEQGVKMVTTTKSGSSIASPNVRNNVLLCSVVARILGEKPMKREDVFFAVNEMYKKDFGEVPTHEDIHCTFNDMENIGHIVYDNQGQGKPSFVVLTVAGRKAYFGK